MDRHDAISLADLAAAGVRLRPTEAVTIARTLILQVHRGELPGVPSTHVVRLLAGGRINVEGPVVAGGRPAARAAQFLSALLPPGRGGTLAATSLRGVIARWLTAEAEGPAGLESLRGFADELAPFAAADVSVAVNDLVARWAAAAQRSPASGTSQSTTPHRAGDRRSTPADLTAMRRARRDTGLSLTEVSRKSRIPVPLLRQLEWGYLRHWPTGLYARTQLVRYARAAGLSQQLVMAAVWPMLEEELRSRQAAPASAPPRQIEIIESSFEKGEILFEDAEVESESAAAARRLVAPVASAPEALNPSDADPGFDERRRSSMVAAAAVLVLTTMGALWFARSQPPAEMVTATRVVRHVPASEPLPELPAPRPETIVPLPVSKPAGLGGVVPIPSPAPAAVVSATSMETVADDGAGYSAVAASSEGAVFADAASLAGDAAESPAGLGLRVARVVDDGSHNGHTRPSPDGTRIAFDSDREGAPAVFVADVNGRHLRRVSGDGPAVAPNWSRDGRLLSYLRAEPDNPDVWNLWMVALDSGESRRLTSDTAGRPLGGSWFPDGHRIAYSRGGALVVYDIDSGQPVTYPSPKAGRTVRAPSVSPDGRWIMFQVAGDGAWLLDVADGSTRRVMSDPSVEEYTWSPDGGRVAYYSRRDAGWSVFVMARR